MSSEFTLMPSGRCYSAPLRKTNRYSNYFIPPVLILMSRVVLVVIYLFIYLYIAQVHDITVGNHELN